MPLGPGSEHLSERLHRMFEREVERRQERSAQLPHERATVLTRAVEVEAALSEPDVSREERKRLRAELQELRQDADDLKREQERLSDDIENARRQWRAAVAVEGAEALTRLTAEMDERDWDKTIDGHLKSVWLCMKYEIPEMLKRGGGVIVNNSSVDGLRAYPFPAGAAYSAAKHGVIGLCSERATFVVGAAVAIDGGYLA